MPMFNFGQQQAQVPQQARPQGGGFLQQLLAPETAMPIAAALLGNQGNSQNFGNAFGAYGQAAAQTAGKNKTLDFFRKNAPEYAEMVDAGMPLNEAWQTYTQQRYAKQADPYLSVGGRIFNKNDQSWLTPPEDPNAAPETGLVPQMMRNPQTGETIYVQPTKDGRLLKSDVPDGFQPYDPYAKSFATGSGNAAGKAQAEADASRKSLSSKMQGLEHVVSELETLADQATYTLAGRGINEGRAQIGMEPTEAAVARTKYIAMVDNQILPLLRDTFGAQFTVEEGKALRSTLGDPNKTPPEKKAVLRAFIEQKKRDVEALGIQAGGGMPGQGQSQNGGVVDYRDYFGGQ